MGREAEGGLAGWREKGRFEENKSIQQLMEFKRLGLTSAVPSDFTLEALRQLVPSAFTEVRGEGDKVTYKVDFGRLREMLGDAIADADEERYGFYWVGKQKAKQEAAQPTRQTLCPVEKESVAWESTQNLYIEGDNLEVLKLLQTAYIGKVKMIYIDPPYNTGNDFVYSDNFAMSREEQDEAMGNLDEEGNRLRRNLDSNPRYHSDWCSMIYSRLLVARTLLSNDGVIFISIDDNEVHNLRKICDEVFGASNFVGDILWNSTKSVTNTAILSVSHTHNLVYFRDMNYFIKNRTEFRLNDNGEGFSNPDNDPRGAWKADPFQVGGWRPNQQYEITNPNTGVVYTPNPNCSWKNDYDKFQELLKDNRIVFGKTGEGGPQRKRYIWEAKKRGKVAKTWWDDVETTANGTQTLKKLFEGRIVFDNPKPVSLIKRFMELGTDKDSLILDFFSGSATTAHAVMKLNAEDGGKRKYIMVQLPEKTPEGSEARKAGYDTICKIGKERIRRAGRQIKEGLGLPDDDLDIGFRVLRLDSSNMKNVYFEPGKVSQASLFSQVDNVEEGRTPLDLLFGCMVDWGVELSLPIRREEVGGKELFVVNDGALIACFEEEIPLETIRYIAGLSPQRLIFRESSFATDADKLNVYEQFKQLCSWSEEESYRNIRVI